MKVAVNYLEYFADLKGGCRTIIPIVTVKVF
jgi:hypothetical protein